MNQTFRIFIVGILSCLSLGVKAADDDETRLLAALIYCESGNQPYEGMLGVGAVVMNRVKSPAYPGSIYGVIYSSGQFTPAMSGKVARVYEGNIPDACIQAAQAAINGETSLWHGPLQSSLLHQYEN